MIAHSPYLKKKSFHLLEGTRNTFWELKGKKMQENSLNFSKSDFFINRSENFILPFKISCHTSKLWNFVKITGPYSTAGLTVAHRCASPMQANSTSLLYFPIGWTATFLCLYSPSLGSPPPTFYRYRVDILTAGREGHVTGVYAKINSTQLWE